MKRLIFGLCVLVLAGLVPAQAFGQSTAEELVSVLKNPGSSTDLRCQAARSLGQLGKKAREIVPDLAVVVKNSGMPKQVRIEVAKALSKIGSRPAADALVDVLSNAGTANDLRITAIKSVAEMGEEGKAALPELKRLGQNAGTDQSIRKAAIEAVVRLEE